MSCWWRRRESVRDRRSGRRAAQGGLRRDAGGLSGDADALEERSGQRVHALRRGRGAVGGERAARGPDLRGQGHLRRRRLSDRRRQSRSSRPKARSTPRTRRSSPPCSNAGARFVGKTQTDELTFSMNGQNKHFPEPINVRAEGRITGGSSSGSAAAVAAKLCDFAIGSDTGGSVRAPASYCGLWGIRPTHGRVVARRAMPLAPSFDTAGYFADDPAIFARVAPVFLGEDEQALRLTRARARRRRLRAASVGARGGGAAPVGGEGRGGARPGEARHGRAGGARRLVLDLPPPAGGRGVEGAWRLDRGRAIRT